MAYTGGPLNELNGKSGISAPHKSVPIMKLIRIHQPKSKNELTALIKFHYEKDCSCGIKSQGTVEDFGRNLFNAQIPYWGEHKFTLKECIRWEYDLFVTQSLKGGIVERKAARQLKKLLSGLSFEEANDWLDEELRIDLTVKRDDQIIAGIQVKPATFLKMRREVITFNEKANRKWDKPVFYLFYNENEEFENLENLISALKKTLIRSLYFKSV